VKMSDDEKVRYITIPSDNFVANTASIISEIFRAPTTSSVITTSVGYAASSFGLRDVGEAARQRRQRRQPQEPREFALSPIFKLVFLTVAVLTLLMFVAQLILAVTMATPSQQTVFNLMGLAWPAGFGALIGFLGGKQLT
jgi:hypothetical protein